MMHDLVILFDVDNTLLNNDRVQADLDVHMSVEHGTAARNRYWEIFETLRSELGYADYLGALERYRMEEMHDPRLLRISNWLVDYPFAEAFDGNVLIYIHKEEELDDVERLYPAKHYVMIDDKLRILDAMKTIWGERVTTVFPQQGHYATDPKILAQYPHGDIQLKRIADLVHHDLADVRKR